MQTGQHQTREIEEEEEEAAAPPPGNDDILVDVSCPACQEEVASCKQCQDDLIRANAADVVVVDAAAPEPTLPGTEGVQEGVTAVATHQEEQAVQETLDPAPTSAPAESSKRKKGQLLSYQPTISTASVDYHQAQSEQPTVAAAPASSAGDAGTSFKKIEPPSDKEPTIAGIWRIINFPNVFKSCFKN